MEFSNQMKFINYLNKNRYFYIFLIFGLLIFFSPMFFSGFDLMFGAGFDVKISNYILEHSFLFLKGIDGHLSFYNAPFGYENIIANFDLLFAYMPIYWFLRLFSNPFTSLQILLMILCLLNYECFYLFVRRLKFSRLASSFASFIFAFNLIRYYNFENIEYFSQFLSILALIFILKVNDKNSRMKNHLYFILFSIFLLLQFYTCFSFGFFLVFGLILFVLFSFFPKASRDYIIKFLKTYQRFIFYYFIGIILLLTPFVYHVVLNEKIVEIAQALSEIKSFSALFRNVSFLDNLFIPQNYISNYENLALSFGVLALVLGVFGLIKLKNKGALTLTFFAIIFLSFSLSALIFYRWAYYFILMSENIKYIDNFIFVALLILSIGMAGLIDYLKNKKYLLVLVIILLMFEQIPMNFDKNSPWKNYSWSKKEFLNSTNLLLDKIKDENIEILLVAKNINDKKYSKIDFEIKQKRANKLLDAQAIWLSAYKNVKIKNAYIERAQNEEKSKVFKISVDIDYDKI